MKTSKGWFFEGGVGCVELSCGHFYKIICISFLFIFSSYTVQTEWHVPRPFFTPVREHWLEWKIAQWVHHEGSIQWLVAPWADALPWSYISLLPFNDALNIFVFKIKSESNTLIRIDLRWITYQAGTLSLFHACTLIKQLNENKGTCKHHLQSLNISTEWNQ